MTDRQECKMELFVLNEVKRATVQLMGRDVGVMATVNGDVLMVFSAKI